MNPASRQSLLRWLPLFSLGLIRKVKASIIAQSCTSGKRFNSRACASKTGFCCENQCGLRKIFTKHAFLSWKAKRLPWSQVEFEDDVDDMGVWRLSVGDRRFVVVARPPAWIVSHRLRAVLELRHVWGRCSNTRPL